MRRLPGAVRKIELAVHQPFGAHLQVVVGRDCLAVYRDQPAADHRVPVEALHARVAQGFLERLVLLGHHINHEAIRRIGRRGLAPTGDQVGAQKHQQHQREQAHRQRADLHDRIGRARRNLARGQHHPARRRGLVHRPAQQLDCKPAQGREHQHGAGKATDGDAAQ